MLYISKSEWYFINSHRCTLLKKNTDFRNDQKIINRSFLFQISCSENMLDIFDLTSIHVIFILSHFKPSFSSMIFSIMFPWWLTPIKNCSNISWLELVRDNLPTVIKNSTLWPFVDEIQYVQCHPLHCNYELIEER